MKTLDLCIIADRFCPTSRTYLTYLVRHGYRVRKILLVDFIGEHAPSRSAKTLWARWRAHRNKRKIWRPEPNYDPEFVALCTRIQSRLPVEIDYFGEFDFASHADRVETLVAEDYNDTDLQRAIAREGDAVFLYTDGGRVPARVLEHPATRILHFHPGVVPTVRGSDCLFWSLLVNGRPGMSCFYMNAGIDTGDIIYTREFDCPDFTDLADIFNRDPAFARRAILHAYDPHLRAQTLIDVINVNQGRDLRKLPAQRQDVRSGRSYYWMHPLLVRRVLRQLGRGAL